MSKTIEIQPIEGTKTCDVVVKVAGMERLRFGPLDGVPLDLCFTVVFQEQSCGKYAAMVSDDFDVSEYLPAGTACVGSPEMPADAPKGKIEQELETMAAKLDAMGTQLADMAAAQIRHEEQMRRLREDLVRWQRLSGVSPRPEIQLKEFRNERLAKVWAAEEVTRLEVPVWRVKGNGNEGKDGSDADLVDVPVKQHSKPVEITQEMIDEARAEEAQEVLKARHRMTQKWIHDHVWPMKGNVTGPPAQGSGAASVTGVTPVTGDSSTADSSTDH